MPDVYAEFIPEIEGSAVPRVEVMRGAAAVGDDRRSRLEAGADGIFDVGAPKGVIGGAVREYAVDVSTGRTLPGWTMASVVGAAIHEGRAGAFGDTSVYRPWASVNRSCVGSRIKANMMTRNIAAQPMTSERIISVSLTCINGKISQDKEGRSQVSPDSASQDVPS